MKPTVATGIRDLTFRLRPPPVKLAAKPHDSELPAEHLVSPFGRHADHVIGPCAFGAVWLIMCEHIVGHGAAGSGYLRATRAAAAELRVRKGSKKVQRTRHSPVKAF